MTYAVSGLYWLPLVILMTITVISMVYPYEHWNYLWRTYLIGGVFVIYAAKAFAVLFLLLADLHKVFKHLLRFTRQKRMRIATLPAKKKISRSKFIQNLGILGGGFVLSGLIIGMVRWAYEFRLRRVSVEVPDLPPVFDCFRIVQISDMHLGSWTSHKAMEEAVFMINKLDADIVVFTGDLVNFTTKEAFPFIESLKRIQAWNGVYAILGNHDYGDYVDWDTEEMKTSNMKDLEEFYEEIGWTLLKNENIILERENEKLALIGIENWSAIPRFPRYGDLEKALKGTEDAAVRILLSHDPTHWETQVRDKHPEILLTLSGHTHGFQFGVESKKFRWSPAQYLYKYWAGYYGKKTDIGYQYLYVNRGLGNIGYPGRVGILPEITLLTLNLAR